MTAQSPTSGPETDAALIERLRALKLYDDDRKDLELIISLASRSLNQEAGEDVIDRITALNRIKELTDKHCDPLGSDYDQGGQDHGNRCYGAIKNLPGADPRPAVGAAGAHRKRFRVHLQTMIESGNRVTHFVCIDRPDRPLDAAIWDLEGRITPYKTPTKENAEDEVKEWDEFLNGPLPAEPGTIPDAGAILRDLVGAKMVHWKNQASNSTHDPAYPSSNEARSRLLAKAEAALEILNLFKGAI